MKNTPCISSTYVLPTRRVYVSFVLPNLWWNSNRRRGEKDEGKTCWNFFLFSDLQGFSAAITEKCYQMPLSDQKTKYLHDVSLSFRIWKRKCFYSDRCRFEIHNRCLTKSLKIDEAPVKHSGWRNTETQVVSSPWALTPGSLQLVSEKKTLACTHAPTQMLFTLTSYTCMDTQTDASVTKCKYSNLIHPCTQHTAKTIQTEMLFLSSKHQTWKSDVSLINVSRTKHLKYFLTWKSLSEIH